MSQSNNTLYERWWHMHDRCNNPKSKSYPVNGGSGIKVVKRWHRFRNFAKDMGPPPKGTFLYRKDITKHYGPGNCEWMPHRQTYQNKKNSRKVGGMSLADIGRLCNISTSSVYDRADRGWTLEDFLQHKEPLPRGRTKDGKAGGRR